MKDKKNKKGEINFTVLFTVIFLIIGLLIILFLYYEFNWKGEIDKNTCHQSVILKASMPTVESRSLVDLPLRCKTDKICITTKLFGGKCDGFIGETNVATKVVSSKPEEQAKEINRIIADNLYDCWSMMGEGKINIFSREFSLKKYPSRCVVCARIDFDNELKAKNTVGAISGLSTFLKTQKPEGGSLTYSEFLTGFNGSRPYNPELDAIPDTYKLEQQSIIFQEFDRTSLPDDIGMAVGGILAAWGASYVPGVGYAALPAAFLVGGYYGRGVGSFIGGIIGEKYIATWAFVPYSTNPQEIEARFVKDVKQAEVLVDGVSKTISYGTINLDAITSSPDVPDSYKLIIQNFKYKYIGVGDNGTLLLSDGSTSTGGASMFQKMVFKEFARPQTDSELDKAKRAFIDKIHLELITKDINLNSFQCSSFESFV